MIEDGKGRDEMKGITDLKRFILRPK